MNEKYLIEKLRHKPDKEWRQVEFQTQTVALLFLKDV